jgi:hypothetical protein
MGQASISPGDLHTLGSSIFVHGNMSKPFEMDCAVEWFGYQVSRVFDARYVIYINKLLVNCVPNKVSLNIDVLCAQV